MNITNIKESLYKSIEKIDDDLLLITIKDLIDQHAVQKGSMNLTDYQKTRISESEQQIAKGEFFSEEQADYLIDKWLKE